MQIWNQREVRPHISIILLVFSLCCGLFAPLLGCSDEVEGPSFNEPTPGGGSRRDLSFPPAPGPPTPPRPDLGPPLIDQALPSPVIDQRPPAQDQEDRSCDEPDAVRLIEPCGYERCVAGQWLRPTGSQELCNGHDDDCDNRSDEGLDVGERCEEVVEGCAVRGLFQCAEGSQTPVCVGRPLMMGAESCDGQDNDCDGMIDEGVSGGGLCCGSINECPEDSQCVEGRCTGTEPPAPMTPPSGDCMNPYPINGPGTYTVDGTDAGNDEASGCAILGAVGADVVFRLRVAEAQRLRLDTAGNLFDTAIYLRQGLCASLEVALNPSTELGCNDNEVEGEWPAAVEFDAAPNVDYFIVVDTTLNPLSIIEFLADQELLDLPFTLNITRL